MTSSTPRPIQSVTNTELYNRWAKVYDTDNNILQAIDDILLPPLLSYAFSLLSSSTPITITELGCGTGRNTPKLLTSNHNIAEINALDLSPSMLSVARERCETLMTSSTNLRFEIFDALDPSALKDSPLHLERKADLVLSTLVLEHLPLDIFFKTVSSFLKPAGILVLTNMHADMGRISQAGFVDLESGEKVRGMSFVYEIEEVVEEGRKWGFEVLGDVGERAVSGDDIGEGRVLGERGRKWVGVRVWFGGVLGLRGEVKG